jgi:hypothetical protein
MSVDLSTLSLRERLVASQILENLERADGKWRKNVDAFKNIDDSMTFAADVAHKLCVAGVLLTRFVPVPPDSSGRVHSLIQHREYRIAPRL